jgi:hypothetical protein
MGWLWLACAVMLAGAGVLVARRTRSRERELMTLCRRAGLEFLPVDPFPDTLWLPFHWLELGRWVRAENVVWHGAEGETVRAFDLITESSEGADQVATTRRFTCASAKLPFGSRRLEIRPREVPDAVGGLVRDEIRMELAPFNHRFRVRCDDRRFAVAFCDQRMMEALLTLPRGVTIAVNEDAMLLRSEDMTAAEVLLLFETARALRRRVPPVVASLFPPRPAKGRHEDRWLQGRWSPDPIGDGEG